MAKKIKFPLEMADGAMVRRDIEELRENFDIEKALGHFLSGKLAEWLEDRFYDDEAEAIRELDKNAPNLNSQLCRILGVEYHDTQELDTAQLERLNEKRAILREKTTDDSIIANADKTALTQEDLSDLIDYESMIYLCGEKFNIPIRKGNKRYIGILGYPKIKIRADSQADLDDRHIVFEHVELPWDTGNNRQTIQTEKPSCGKAGSNSHGKIRVRIDCPYTYTNQKIDITDMVLQFFPNQPITESKVREFAIRMMEPSYAQSRIYIDEIPDSPPENDVMMKPLNEIHEIFIEVWIEFLRWNVFNQQEPGMLSGNKSPGLLWKDPATLGITSESFSQSGFQSLDEYTVINGMDPMCVNYTWDVTCNNQRYHSLEHYYMKLSDSKKRLALKMIGQEKYTENELIYARVSHDLSAGWAFTIDSFCYGGGLGQGIVPYKNISYASGQFDGHYGELCIICKNGETHRIDGRCRGFEIVSGKGISPEYGGVERIVAFLETVKNLV